MDEFDARERSVLTDAHADHDAIGDAVRASFLRILGARAAADVTGQLDVGVDVAPARVRDAVSTPAVRLAVGISDGLPKLAVHRLLQPVIPEPHLRLICHEGEFDDLLGDLALHRLDIVLSDRTAPVNPNIKLYSHRMGSSSMAW